MNAFILTAPRQMGQIPKGWILPVVSSRIGSLNPDDVKKAILAAGFDKHSSSYCSPGNWIVKVL